MSKVLYGDLEWDVVDDRMKDTILIRRFGSILRVKKDLVVSLDSVKKHQLRVQKIKLENRRLMLPVDINLLFRTSSVDDLTNDQLEALERFIYLRTESEKRNYKREKQYRKAHEKCYCLSIKQPWTDAIFRGCRVLTLDAEKKFKSLVDSRVFKDIENRIWRLPRERMNTRVYIHASQSYCKDGETWMLANGLEPVSKSEVVLGKIIGSVIFLSDTFRPARPWAMKGQRHWEIYSPLLLPEPIPYKGRLKFYELDRKGLGLPSYDKEIEQQQQKLNSLT